jgi:hypothetical protein
MPTRTPFDSGANRASPNDLITLFTELADAAVATQGGALVVERQIDLTVVVDPTGVAGAAMRLQQEARRGARFFLNRGLQEVGRALADGDAAVNLMRALKARLDAGADAPKAIAAAGGSMERFYFGARDFAVEARRIETAAAVAAGTFDDALAAAVAELDGPEGEAAATRDAIDETERELDARLGELIANANLVGKGVKTLATYALTTLTDGAAEAKRPKPAGATGGDAVGDAAKGGTPAIGDAAGDAAKGKPKKEFAIGEFPVEGLAITAEGAEGVEAAVAAYRRASARLGTLYQRLAQVDALLAAAAAIGGQARAFAAVARRVADAADALATSWGVIVGGMSALAADAIRNAADGPDLDAALADLGAAAPQWTRLSQRLRRLEAALAGATAAPRLAEAPEAFEAPAALESADAA